MIEWKRNQFPVMPDPQLTPLTHGCGVAGEERAEESGDGAPGRPGRVLNFSQPKQVRWEG